MFAFRYRYMDVWSVLLLLKGIEEGLANDQEKFYTIFFVDYLCQN